MERTERDTLGEVNIQSDKYWGPQTQRAHNNFEFTQHKMPIEIIYALALVKKAAAKANADLQVLSPEKAELIVKACDKIINGDHDDQFPLYIWQSGSGTQTNMNLNEVIVNIAQEINGGNLNDEKKFLHPNDDVNKSQSTNDVFPTAVYIASTKVISEHTLPALVNLQYSLQTKADDFMHIIKTGRTHLMDATPLSLGKEFAGYASQVNHAIHYIKQSLKSLSTLAIGGTATGTGINAPGGFDIKAVEYICRLSGYDFEVSDNKFESLSVHDAIVNTSAALTTAAMSLFKIANDIRLYASGPRCGIGELLLPANEPGSSIMPGKVNPTQCESLTMACAKIFGNNATIGFANSQGQFQLNTFKPLLGYCLIETARLLAESVHSFTIHCVNGIEPNLPVIQKNLDNSLMLVTAISPLVGYDKAAQIAKKALLNGTTLREEAIASGFIDAESFDEAIEKAKQ